MTVVSSDVIMGLAKAHDGGAMMNWQNRVTDILGSRYPIVQGAFAGFGTSALAAAVSEAGGFGIITAGALRTPERLREDIRKARSQTDRPFGVNLSIGVCPNIEEMEAVAIEEKVPVIFTAVYRAEEHGKRIHEAGLKWVHKVATVHHAVAAERQGADAVVLVGLEGAGFKSIHQLPTLIAITSAVRLLKVPVIAAGGIGDARGFLAALAMGAEGVYMGTRFMATRECPISERYKQALVDAHAWDRTYRERALAPPKPEEYERVMKERGKLPMGEWLRRLEMVFVSDSPDVEPALPDDYRDYDPEVALRMAGGSLAVGVIDSVVSVRELIDAMVGEAEEMLRVEGNLGSLVG
ncbi:MAG: nitronate monooxygenase [Chloroflexota bacterium]|nr:nitronate monooxygenase [Chloroflexota bacterium]